MTDKLVVGHIDAIRHMSGLMAQTNDHACDEANRVPVATMAQVLWEAGYRFDTEARTQWLIVEMRSRLRGDEELGKMFLELLALLGADA
jgi:hypothetical protein